MATDLAIGLTIKKQEGEPPTMPEVTDAVQRAEAICTELQRLMQGKPARKQHTVAWTVAAVLGALAVAAACVMRGVPSTARHPDNDG